MGKLMDMMNAEIAATNKLISAHQHAENKQRRERIATALMAALYANPAYESLKQWQCAENAIRGADALIAELDREQPQEVAE